MESIPRPGFIFVMFGIGIIFSHPSVELETAADATPDANHPVKYGPENNHLNQLTLNETNYNSNVTHFGRDKVNLVQVSESKNNKRAVNVKNSKNDNVSIPSRMKTRESSESISNTLKSDNVEKRNNLFIKERATLDPITEFTRSQNRPRQQRRFYRRFKMRQRNRNAASFVTSSPSSHEKNTRHNPASITARGPQSFTRYSLANFTWHRNSMQNPSIENYNKNKTVSRKSRHRLDKINAEKNITTPSPSVPLENLTPNGIQNNSEKPCLTCKTRQMSEEEIVAIRIEQFKDLLLDKLRMSEEDLSPGSLSGSFPKLPREIMEKTLRDNAMQENIEEFYAQDKEIMLEGQDLGRKCIKSRTRKQVTGCYIFVLNGNIKGEVASARLWLYKTPDQNDLGGQTIRVFQLEKTRRGRLQRKNLIIRQDANVKEGWITMNVTRSVRSWVDKRMSTAMLAIRCDTCRTHNHKALYGAKGGYRPLLVIEYSTAVVRSRTKRSENDCDPRYECCKRNLVINFSRIGMPNIHQPQNISAGYCFGYCNDSPNYRYNHTQLVQSARLNDPLLNDTIKRQLLPCCIPFTFKDTFLLLFTRHGIVDTTVPNVIVASCGCV